MISNTSRALIILSSSSFFLIFFSHWWECKRRGGGARVSPSPAAAAASSLWLLSLPSPSSHSGGLQSWRPLQVQPLPALSAFHHFLWRSHSWQHSYILKYKSFSDASFMCFVSWFSVCASVCVWCKHTFPPQKWLNSSVQFLLLLWSRSNCCPLLVFMSSCWQRAGQFVLFTEAIVSQCSTIYWTMACGADRCFSGTYSDSVLSRTLMSKF